MDAVGCRGSSGVTDAVHGYRDNDITSGTVNTKHTPNIMDGPRNFQKQKPKVASWVQP